MEFRRGKIRAAICYALLLVCLLRQVFLNLFLETKQSILLYSETLLHRHNNGALRCHVSVHPLFPVGMRNIAFRIDPIMSRHREIVFGANRNINDESLV